MKYAVPGLLFALCLTSFDAYAACPPAPISGTDDLVLRMHATGGYRAGTLVANSLNGTEGDVEGVVVYDSADKTLKLCDGDGWTSLGGGAGGITEAAGDTGEIQFNDGEGGLAADAGLLWDSATKRLGVGADTSRNATINLSNTTTTAGPHFGVFSRVEAASGYALAGSAGAGGVGVAGTSSGTGGVGVSGAASGTGGRGVYGTAYDFTGESYGVFGQASSSEGYGVYGMNTSGGYGIYSNGPAHVQGDLGVSGPAHVQGDLGVSGRIAASDRVTASAYYQSSDRALKTNIQAIADPFTLLAPIAGKHFLWKESGKGAYGLIAQDVESTMPEAVGTNAAGDKTVDYSQLIGPLIEAVKILKAENDNLRAEINILKEGMR